MSKKAHGQHVSKISPQDLDRGHFHAMETAIVVQAPYASKHNKTILTNKMGSVGDSGLQVAGRLGFQTGFQGAGTELDSRNDGHYASGGGGQFEAFPGMTGDYVATVREDTECTSCPISSMNFLITTTRKVGPDSGKSEFDNFGLLSRGSYGAGVAKCKKSKTGNAHEHHNSRSAYNPGKVGPLLRQHHLECGECNGTDFGGFCHADCDVFKFCTNGDGGTAAFWKGAVAAVECDQAGAKDCLDGHRGLQLACELARRILVRAGRVGAAAAAAAGGGSGSGGGAVVAKKEGWASSQIALIVFGADDADLDDSPAQRAERILSVPSDWKVVRSLLRIYLDDLGDSAGGLDDALGTVGGGKPLGGEMDEGAGVEETEAADDMEAAEAEAAEATHMDAAVVAATEPAAEQEQEQERRSKKQRTA